MHVPCHVPNLKHSWCCTNSACDILVSDDWSSDSLPVASGDSGVCCISKLTTILICCQLPLVLHDFGALMLRDFGTFGVWWLLVLLVTGGFFDLVTPAEQWAVISNPSASDLVNSCDSYTTIAWWLLVLVVLLVPGDWRIEWSGDSWRAVASGGLAPWLHPGSLASSPPTLTLRGPVLYLIRGANSRTILFSPYNIVVWFSSWIRDMVES